MEGTETGWSRPAEPAPRWRALLDRALLGGRSGDQPADDDPPPASGGEQRPPEGGHRGAPGAGAPAGAPAPLPSRPVNPLDRRARTPLDRRPGAVSEPPPATSGPVEHRPAAPGQRPVNPFEKRPAASFVPRPATTREPRPVNPLDRRAPRTFDGYAGRAAPVSGGQAPDPPHSFFNPVPRPASGGYPSPAEPVHPADPGYPAEPAYRTEQGYPAPAYPARGPHPADPRYPGYPEPTALAAAPAPVPVLPHSIRPGATQPDPTQPEPLPDPTQPDPTQPGPGQPGPGQPGPGHPGPGPTQPTPSRPTAVRASALPGAVLQRGAVTVGPVRTAPPAAAVGIGSAAVVSPGLAAAGVPTAGQAGAPPGIEWRQSGADGETERAISVLRRAIGGPRVLAFANPKGGVHKTTATVLAAASIGSVRGRGVLAWDDNELRGTLGLRAGSARHARTIRHLIADLALLEDLHGEDLTNRLDDYLRHAADGSYDVLAGEESPRFAQRLDHSTVRRIMDLLRHTHDVICVDTGNNVESVNWQTVLQTADQLVVTTVPREDAAFTADWMLDLLHEIGMGELASNAVTLLSCSTPGHSPLLEDLTRHFATRTRAVAVVPYDPALETGSSIEYAQLQPGTRDAWLRASSVMLEPFAH